MNMLIWWYTTKEANTVVYGGDICSFRLTLRHTKFVKTINWLIDDFPFSRSSIVVSVRVRAVCAELIRVRENEKGQSNQGERHHELG